MLESIGYGLLSHQWNENHGTMSMEGGVLRRVVALWSVLG
jgi:hypothetical protein